MSWLSIDYIQYSTPPHTVARATVWEQHAGLFYKETCEGEYGERIYRGNPNTDKWLVVASGKICDAMQADMSPSDMVGSIIDGGGKVSRIDIQCTTCNTSRYHATPNDVLAACEGGKMQTTIGDKTVKFISSMDEVNYGGRVETLYIGSLARRGKTGLFRVYDKGLESGLQSDFLTRYEVEWRKSSAHTQAKRIINGWHLSEVMDNRIHFDAIWWYAALDNADSDADDIRRGIAAKNKDDEMLAKASYWLWANKMLKSIGSRLACEPDAKVPEIYRGLIESMQLGYNKQVNKNPNGRD